jgi:hypothetical protein
VSRGVRLTAFVRFGLGIAALSIGVSACAPAEEAGRTVELDTLNDSGVTGTAVLTDLGNGRTLVSVQVDPAGHPLMPAHIHPGSCAELVPQPRYPLADVADGVSETEIDATLDELFAGDLALNLHRSRDDFATYTACADLE